MCTREEFVKVFDKLLNIEIEDMKQNYALPETAIHWIEKLHRHAVPGGKMNRGLTVISSLRSILNREFTDEELFLSQVLGWCIEWLQGFSLVADDIMDNSITRRGVPCWYRMEKPIPGAEGETVGIIACNDFLIIETVMYRVLRRHFRTKEYYLDLLEMFQEVSFQTEMGQLLDLTSNTI
jgi:farnesyl diphosphate synthase